MRVYDLQAEKLVTEQGERVYSPNNKPSWDDVNSKPDFAMLQAVRGKAQFEQMRQQNNDKYAASGFIYHGKHRNNGSSEIPINEGLFTATYGSNSNVLFSGNKNASFKIGESKTDFAVTNIAGFISNLVTLDSNYLFNYKLPEAPDGTVVYDSSGDCRGTGKPNLDLSKEVDPKYGDIAAVRNEAVARAFEGIVKNGDFRLGDDGSWPAPNSVRGSTSFDGQSMTVTNTVRVDSTQSSGTMAVYQRSLTENIETKIVLNVEIISGSGTRVYVKAGSPAVSDLTITETGIYEAVVSPTGESLYLYVGGDGVDDNVVKFESISVQPINEEVVTERVDLVGLEFYLEEVTKANPFVYPRGCIQSQAATMNSIATTRSNRPDTYYAVYDGDTSSVGKGVDFWAATSEQKIAMVSDASNNLFNVGDDLIPKIVQWRVRQRSIAGAGNGDWESVNSSVSSPSLCFKGGWSSGSLVEAQGFRDKVAYLLPAGDVVMSYSPTEGYDSDLQKSKRYAGIFSLRDPLYGNSQRFEDIAYNGECYFYVVATVPRLNQGAYHPGLNPLGADFFRSTTGYGTYWYKNTVADWLKVETVLDCFTPTKKGSSNGVTTPFEVSTEGSRGSISSGYSGRPDGKFYDAIYASGLGGVIDWRLPAHDMSSKEEASKVFQKVVNGVYRGAEKLKYTSNIISSGKIGATRNEKYFLMDVVDNTDGKYSWITATSASLPTKSHGFFIIEGEVKEVTGVAKTGTNFIVVVCKGKSFESKEGSVINGCFGYYKNSVSGEFLQADIIGDPSQILTTPQLKKGWLGGWIPVIPDGVSPFTLTKKRLTNTPGANLNSISTKNNGASWESISRGFNPYDNSQTTVLPTGYGVQITYYDAFAKQTEQSLNRPVLHGSSGIEDVFITNDSLISPVAGRGVLLKESLIGGVSGSMSYTNGRIQQLPLIQGSCTDAGKLISLRLAYIPKHGEVLVDGGSDVDTVKILPHQVEEKSQLFLNFIANELKHDGTDWGDDGTVKVVENGTYTNLNGEVCLADIHKLTIPYGYIKQK